MDFFAQLDQQTLPELHYPGVQRAHGLKAALFREYLKRFNNKLASFKPLALVNGLPAYDLTQAPLYSEANQRVLEMGASFHLLKRPARPISAVIAITHACHCDCMHCSARDYMKSGRKALRHEQLIDLFDQALAMGAASIVLTGGEPTLYPRLLDLVAHVPRDKAAVSMFTNGARLDRAFAGELRAAGLNAALVSVDGPDPESHDRYRRHPGSFAETTRAIEALLEAGSLVGISSYVSHEGVSAGLFDRMLQLTTERGAHQLFLFDAVPSGAMRDDELRHLLTLQDRDYLRRRTMEVNATPGGPGVMGQSWINSPDGFGCFAGFYQCYVSASGDVCPCDFTPVTFGNLADERLETIWDRMRGSDEWGQQARHCRMQDACFRARSVDLVPPGEPLPVRWERLLELREKSTAVASSAPCACHDSESAA
ncbi:MAG: radical SAM protein [Pseudomonadota bacterium]